VSKAGQCGGGKERAEFVFSCADTQIPEKRNRAVRKKTGGKGGQFIRQKVPGKNPPIYNQKRRIRVGGAARRGRECRAA